jgi:myo-inositol-1(or 4)-monophosphatase
VGRETLDLDAARRIALSAATASRDLLHRPPAAKPRSQTGRDIKLVEDQASETLIAAALRAQSPWPILSEEAGWIGDPPAASDPYWALDPLDGSFNFHRGVPLCCVSVGLCVGLEPIAGAIYDFNRDELFWGGAGLGLELNGQAVPPRAPAEDILTTGFPVRGDFTDEGMARVVGRMRDFRKIRMIGSASLSLAWVASGRFDAYEETGIRWWDVAAGLALVQGAGGTIEIEGETAEQPMTIKARGGNSHG